MRDTPSLGSGGEPDSQAIVIVGLVGAILVFVLIVGLVALFHRAEDAEIERKVVAQVPEELDSLRARQLEILNGYRWIDPAKGIVGIPIDRAIGLLVEREAGRAEAPAAAGSPRARGSARAPLRP